MLESDELKSRLTTPAHDLAPWISYVRYLAITLIVLQLGGNFFELFLTHSTSANAEVAETIIRGRYSGLFWGLSIGLGLLMPLLIFAFDTLRLYPVAGLLLLIGVFTGQHILVRAPQQIPLS